MKIANEGDIPEPNVTREIRPTNHPTISYLLQTWIPEKNAMVSTVAHTVPIGWDRTSETIVFTTDEKGKIISFAERYFKSHGYDSDHGSLLQAHTDIVEGTRSGEIPLQEDEDEDSTWLSSPWEDGEDEVEDDS